MRLIKTLVAIACIGSAAIAQAGPTMGFEDLMKNDPGNVLKVGGFYTGSTGATFGDTFWGVVSEDSGGLGLFKPKAGSGSAAVGLFNNPDQGPSGSASGDVVVTKGFGSFLSFSYALGDRTNTSASLLLLDASGHAMGSAIALTQNGYGPVGTPPCDVICNWTDIKIDFTGTAFGFRLTGADGISFFDDITLGDAVTNPPGDLPEPGSMALVLAGFGAAAWGVRRRPAAAS